MVLAGIGTVAFALAAWALRLLVGMSTDVTTLAGRLAALEDAVGNAKKSRGDLFGRVSELETARKVDAARAAAKIAEVQLSSLEAENARLREDVQSVMSRLPKRGA